MEIIVAPVFNSTNCSSASSTQDKVLKLTFDSADMAKESRKFVQVCSCQEGYMYTHAYTPANTSIKAQKKILKHTFDSAEIFRESLEIVQVFSCQAHLPLHSSLTSISLSIPLSHTFRL